VPGCLARYRGQAGRGALLVDLDAVHGRHGEDPPHWAAGAEPLGAVIGHERVLLGFPAAGGTMALSDTDPSGRTVASRALVDDVMDALTELTESCQREGALRSDVTSLDVGLLARAAVAPPPDNGTRIPSTQWQRTLAVMLDGLRPQAARPLPGVPPTGT
jgi:hypothetical protein